MERRQLLKGLGGIAGLGVLGGTGIAAMSGSADAEAGLNVPSDNVELLKNDDGELRQVRIDPRLEINWGNLDDPVGAVSIFVEARARELDDGPNGGFWPLMRAEPVLLPDEGSYIDASPPSTSGHFTMNKPLHRLASNRTLNLDWSSGTSDEGNLIVADDEHGAPDYSGASEGYLQGANVSGNTIPSGEPLLNGEYGAAFDAEEFDVLEDGAKEEPIVDVRYTVQLLELGLNHFAAITGYDPVEITDGTVGAIEAKLEEWYNHSTGEWTSGLENSSFLTDVQPEDITVIGVDNQGNYTTADSAVVSWESNQKLPVMTRSNPDDTGRAEYPWHGPSRHAANARAYLDSHSDFPGFMYDVTSFRVPIENEPASTDGSGSTGGSSK